MFLRVESVSVLRRKITPLIPQVDCFNKKKSDLSGIHIIIQLKFKADIRAHNKDRGGEKIRPSSTPPQAVIQILLPLLEVQYQAICYYNIASKLLSLSQHKRKELDTLC